MRDRLIVVVLVQYVKSCIWLLTTRGWDATASQVAAAKAVREEAELFLHEATDGDNRQRLKGCIARLVTERVPSRVIDEVLHVAMHDWQNENALSVIERFVLALERGVSNVCETKKWDAS